MPASMRVVKRNGAFEEVSFDKVLRRIQTFCHDLDNKIDAFTIAGRICNRIYDGVPTKQLDELAAELCSSLMTEHPDWGILAARIIISNHHKNTLASFKDTMALLWGHKDGRGTVCPLISNEIWDVTEKHADEIEAAIDYGRDFNFDYFGFKTLERSYLMRVNNVVVERPQHMLMRVALGIHGDDIKRVLETYELMSKKYFIHATPTLFNAGTPRNQLASCFLAHVDDSIDGIFETLQQCALISKYAGGIGLSIQDVRAAGSFIRGTNGYSSGTIPMLRVFNNTALYVNQAGKRNGSFAVYIEPWHADIESFLDLRKNQGNEEERCRDLFTGLWINDLFMKRVEENGEWSLMCPDECPGLSDAIGEEFERLYVQYEEQGRYKRRIKAQQLFINILKSQIETGTPYMCYKDAVNIKSNQKNLGTIKSSNLCSEIMEYNNSEETAVCNLASIALPTYVVTTDDGSVFYDFEKLHKVARIVTRNLNKVIDRTFYPTQETRRSNMRHRPIGLGVQGLADTFAMMRIPFDSEDAAALNRRIFETIYHGAVTESVQLARERKDLLEDFRVTPLDEEKALPAKWAGAYSSFVGSPASQGKLQFDLWNVAPGDMWDWASLKQELAAHGMRNSLLLAPMPTASTSQILGFNESIEPFTSNIYQRSTLAGEFFVINKYLIRDLIKLGLWDVNFKNKMLMNGGSIQNIDGVPDEIKRLYKTAFEIRQKVLIDQAADRGIYVCQSQSLNLFVEDPDIGKLTNMHFYGWKKGLKTGMYYLRTKAKSKAQAFNMEPAKSSNVSSNAEPAAFACSRDNPNCELCSA